MSATTETSGAMAIRPFHVDIPEEALEDLRRRIAATRLSSRELVDDRSQGVQLATIQELARYWTTEYDWRRCEARLNALPQLQPGRRHEQVCVDAEQPLGFLAAHHVTAASPSTGSSSAPANKRGDLLARGRSDGAPREWSSREAPSWPSLNPDRSGSCAATRLRARSA